MLKDQNELLTQVGPGTPGGEMLRRYWTPVALSTELPPGGAPLPVRLMGEDLALFRDDASTPGLLGLHCSHRGADLSYGRVEDGGLRCLYHGWLYDRHGRCLEQPGEPIGMSFQDKIRHRAYPCHEVAGVIFAYLGPGEPPLFPRYELFQVPDGHRWIHKHYHECNYLQGNEGNIDSLHLEWLHKFLPGGKYRPNPADSGNDPGFVLHCEDTHFGVRIFEFTEVPEGPLLESKNFVLPLTCAVGGGSIRAGDGYLMNWHVPIDDTHHWRYSTAFRRSEPIDRRVMQARESVTDEHYRFHRNKTNRYLQDREELKTDTFAGLGPVFVNGDHLVTETAGAIQDRAQEHLAATDAGIVATRNRLLAAIRDVQEGRDPPNVIRTPEQQERLLEITVIRETLPPGITFEQYRA